MSTTSQPSSTGQYSVLLVREAGIGRSQVVCDVIGGDPSQPNSKQGWQLPPGMRWKRPNDVEVTLCRVLSTAMGDLSSEDHITDVGGEYQSIIHAWSATVERSLALSRQKDDQEFANQEEKVTERSQELLQQWRNSVYCILRDQLHETVTYILDDSLPCISREMERINTDFPQAVSSLHPGMPALILGSLWSRVCQRSDLVISALEGTRAVVDHLQTIWPAVAGDVMSGEGRKPEFPELWQEHQPIFHRTRTRRRPDTPEAFEAAFFHHTDGSSDDTENMGNFSDIARAHEIKLKHSDLELNKVYDILRGMADSEIEEDVKTALSGLRTDDELISAILDWTQFSITQSGSNASAQGRQWSKGKKGKKPRRKGSKEKTDTNPGQSTIAPSKPSSFQVFVNLRDGYEVEALKADLGKFKPLLGPEGQIPDDLITDMVNQGNRPEGWKNRRHRGADKD